MVPYRRAIFFLGGLLERGGLVGVLRCGGLVASCLVGLGWMDGMDGMDERDGWAALLCDSIFLCLCFVGVETTKLRVVR